ncbi:MAG: hypothetical protein EBY21_07725 [Alphaproteobacteria bacterium]|nr:hypothetical protein [Alphaproteobacteria bacterium]
MRQFASCIVFLALTGCGLLAKPPDQKAIYNALQNAPEGPFNIDSIECQSQAEGAYACSFDATIVAGSLPGFVGDRRPDYKRVRMSASFAPLGQGWRASSLVQLTEPAKTP